MRLAPGDLDDPRIRALLEHHVTTARAATALAIGALKRLSSDHGEIKSMHTAAASRRKGIGRAMLYRGAGFLECAPFGDYAEDPDSVFMSLDLAASLQPEARD